MENEEIFLPTIPQRFEPSSGPRAYCLSGPSVAVPDAPIAVEFNSTDLQLTDTLLFQYTPFQAELELMAGMEAMQARGEQMLHLVYTYRSVSLAIPELDSSEGMAMRIEYAAKIQEVLRPELVKLKSLMRYVYDALHCYQQTIKYMLIKEQNKELIPSLVIEHANHLLDLLIRLSRVCVVMLPAMQADLRRMAATATSHEVKEEVAGLTGFLAEGSVMSRLKAELSRMPSVDAVLTTCMSTALHLLSNAWLLPQDEWVQQRILVYGLYLLDSEEVNAFKVLQVRWKRAVVTACMACIRRYAYLPIHHDVIVDALQVVKSLPHYTAALSAWLPDPAHANNITFARDGHIGSSIAVAGEEMQSHEDMRRVINSLLVRIALLRRRYETYPFLKGEDTLTEETARNVSALIMEALTACGVLRRALDLYLVHKVAQHGSAVDGQEEIVVDIVCMLKALCSGLQLLEGLSVLCGRYVIHRATQHCLGGALLPLLHRVDKRNKPSLGALLQLRDLLLDLGVDQHTLGSANAIPRNEQYAQALTARNRDYKEYSRKKGHVEGAKCPVRGSCPSPTQIAILHLFTTTLVEGSESNSNILGGLCKDLEKADLVALSAFNANARELEFLLDGGMKVAKCLADCSSLWMREGAIAHANAANLSLTSAPHRLKVVTQMPIAVSIPYVLLSSLLSSAPTPTALDSLVCLLDVYNDSFSCALHVLGSQVLADEVEAEVTLVMDLLPHLLIEQIYSSCKAQPSTASVALLGVQDLPLLGRRLDLHAMLYPLLLARLRGDMDLAIRRFEDLGSGNLGLAAGLLGLRPALDMLSALHAALFTAYPHMPSFSRLLEEVDEAAIITRQCSRISSAFLRGLGKDVISSMVYNTHTERFIPTSVSTFEASAEVAKASSAQALLLYGTPEAVKAFDSLSKAGGGFFDKTHLSVALSLGSVQCHLPMLLDQLNKHMADKLQDIARYLPVILNALPITAGTNIPYKGTASATTNPLYLHWYEHLHPLMGYADIRGELLQALRELGNTLLLLRGMDQCDAQANCHDTLQMKHMGGGQGTSWVEKVVRIVSADMLDTSSTTSGVRRQEPLRTMPGVIRGLFEQCVPTDSSLFSACLRTLEDNLYTTSLLSEWSLTPASLASGDGGGFAHFFSALLFIFSIEEEGDGCLGIFGHGVLVGGAVLLHLLQQAEIFRLIDCTGQIAAVHSILGVSSNDEVYQRFLVSVAAHRAVIEDWLTVLSQAYAPRPSYAKKYVTSSTTVAAPKRMAKPTRVLALKSTRGSVATAGTTRSSMLTSGWAAGGARTALDEGLVI